MYGDGRKDTGMINNYRVREERTQKLVKPRE